MPNFKPIFPITCSCAELTNNNKVTCDEVNGGRVFKESPLSDALLATYYVPMEAQRPRMTSSILVQDARVLSVGNANASSSVDSPRRRGHARRGHRAGVHPDRA